MPTPKHHLTQRRTLREIGSVSNLCGVVSDGHSLYGQFCVTLSQHGISSVSVLSLQSSEAELNHSLGLTSSNWVFHWNSSFKMSGFTVIKGSKTNKLLYRVIIPRHFILEDKGRCAYLCVLDTEA